MSTGSHPLPPDIEIAHVLFVDIVGYSVLPMEEQTRFVQLLQQLLRDTAEFRRAEADRELIRIPTGDGVALVFFRNPAAPVRCALELARALQNAPRLKLRMGVHTGPVYRVEDINANVNVSGGGINMAQRVMDCGDAGHVLLSSTIAELLGQLGAWSEALHDLGEWEVKHGVRLHLFNLYTNDVGNPQLPERLRHQFAPAAATGTAFFARPAGADVLIALLYKRNAQPDEALLQRLETRLSGPGFKVFVDRHLMVGVDWAKEIERQVRTADAVIPLLSAASVQSEMLAFEVQIAHESAQQRQGKPRLLPVRVNFTGPLPEPMAGILDPLQQAVWTGAQDDEALVKGLLDALRSPEVYPQPGTRKKLEPVGGAVPIDSSYYVVRPTDEEFQSAIARRDSIVLVKGARQMGKTSLLARGLQRARESGAKVVLTDFQKLNTQHLAAVDGFYLTLGDFLADQLDLEVLPEDVWDKRRSPNTNFERFLRREVLGKLSAPLIWGLDEVDRLFACGFASEVFGLFRSWHNERALDTSGPWTRLTLAIAYATEAHLFITDVNQSPFNVGTRLTLQDFTFDQVQDLNGRHGHPLRDEAEVARFFRLVGGHPYLVRRGLHELTASGKTIVDFEAGADLDEGIFGDHLRRILVLLAKDAELCGVVRGILRGQPCTNGENFYRLRSAGVMAGESASEVHPRCQLYTVYLRRHLL